MHKLKPIQDYFKRQTKDLIVLNLKSVLVLGQIIITTCYLHSSCYNYHILIFTLVRMLRQRLKHMLPVTETVFVLFCFCAHFILGSIRKFALVVFPTMGDVGDVSGTEITCVTSGLKPLRANISHPYSPFSPWDCTIGMLLGCHCFRMEELCLNDSSGGQEARSFNTSVYHMEETLTFISLSP